MEDKAINIAIIEDNDDLRKELNFFLTANGYRVWDCCSAELFWRQLHTEPTDIILIDVGLPGEDGFAVVQHLSKLERYGLIILTARGNQDDKLLGLQSGADLYLIKPINFSKLINKINTLQQRMIEINSPSSKEDLFNQTLVTEKNEPDFILNQTNYEIKIANQPDISLTPIEFSLLEKLLSTPEQIHSKRELYHHLWPNFDTDVLELHRLDVILSRLRIKFRDNKIEFPIRSIFGKGLVYIPRS